MRILKMMFVTVLAAGASLLMAVLFLRESLLIATVVSVVALLSARLFFPERFRKVLYGVIILHVLLIASPVDIRVTRHGPGGIRMKRVIYGLPSKEGLERIGSGECIAGGCLPPPCRPGYVLIVTL